MTTQQDVTQAEVLIPRALAAKALARQQSQVMERILQKLKDINTLIMAQK